MAQDNESIAPFGLNNPAIISANQVLDEAVVKIRNHYPADSDQAIEAGLKKAFGALNLSGGFITPEALLNEYGIHRLTR